MQPTQCSTPSQPAFAHPHPPHPPPRSREPSRTLNAKETVSRGCALQCAMLSPTFRVRDFQVLDSFPYGVQFRWGGWAGGWVGGTAAMGGSCCWCAQCHWWSPEHAPQVCSALHPPAPAAIAPSHTTPPTPQPALHHRRSWEKDGQAVTSVVFERGSLVPSAKMLTFYRSEPFSIRAEYTPDSDIPATADRSIGARGCGGGDVSVVGWLVGRLACWAFFVALWGNCPEVCQAWDHQPAVPDPLPPHHTSWCRQL